jgi:hypothetical protein
MKRILCFSTAAGRCLVPRMSFDLVEGLRRLGFDATLLLVAQGEGDDLPPPEVAAPALAIPQQTWWRLIPNSRVVEETLGFLESGGQMIMDWNAVLAFPDAPFPRISLLTDAPWSKLAEIRGNLSPRSGLGVVDINHGAFLRDFGVENRSVFVPHGGPSDRGDGGRLSAAERDIPILFVGNLQSRPDRAFIQSVLGADAPKVVSEIFQVAVDAASDGVDPYLALRGAAAERSVDLIPDLGDSSVLAMTRQLATWVESNRRFRLLTSIRSHPVHLVGQVGEGYFDRLPDTITLGGFLWGHEVLERMRNARITLNTVGVFPGGSHERIWYGMHAGSLVVTDPSDFLAETFEDGRTVVFLDRPEDADTVLGEYLSDPARQDRMTAEALEVYLEHHTWTERAGRVVRGFGL